MAATMPKTDIFDMNSFLRGRSNMDGVEVRKAAEAAKAEIGSSVGVEVVKTTVDRASQNPKFDDLNRPTDSVPIVNVSF